ncbi:MAG: hypothetical protein KF716_21160 [Anaerolineae bacterium]|nr:hypothetical protein [Anaerolineae bacterium]
MAIERAVKIEDEFIEFLLSSPSLAQIVEFRVSETAQARLRYLLDANRNALLTPDERAELDEISRVEHFVTLVKARAMKKLKQHDAHS